MTASDLALAPDEEWSETCDTLHAHTQVLGKLAVALAPPEPQLQQAALRLTARGWETGLLPAPDGRGGLVAALDLGAHEAVVEHSDGRSRRIALTPDKPVGEVTRAVLAAVREISGPVEIDPKPQEVAIGWWPGDGRYGRAAFYAYAHPMPDGFADAELPHGRWDQALGEYVLDWDDAVAGGHLRATALEFARAAFRHGCQVCDWDPALAASADGEPPPVA